VAEVLVRIHRRVVDVHFIVHVRPGGASRETDIADGVTARDALSGNDGEARHMTVERRDAVAMVDDDRAAVAVMEVRFDDGAVRRRDDALSVATADVRAAMEGAFAVERIRTLAE